MREVLTATGSWVENAWADAAVLPLAAFLGDPDTRAVRLAPADDPAELAPHLGRLALVAVEFPVFGDGRGYSIAALLRRRLGFSGELRAVGDVLVDQLFALKRVGFSSFVLRDDQDRARAVRALATFSDAYQGAGDQPLPAFRRHVRPAATERVA
jgi:uncharacterized protein (DUF934 family)